MIDHFSSEFLSKGKRSLRANVVFCMILGGLFSLCGIPVLFSSTWPVGAFMEVMGLAMVIGGLVYSNALKTKKQA